MARPEGFEPPIFRIGICCVIQLRHERNCVLYYSTADQKIQSLFLKIIRLSCAVCVVCIIVFNLQFNIDYVKIYQMILFTYGKLFCERGKMYVKRFWL